MDNTKELPTLVSMCSGYGGIERGIERVIGRVRVLAHVEIEAYAIANLVDKMETGQMVPAPVWTDVKTFPAEKFRGCVDILTSGYPCQPFSAAGKRRGKEDPRHLWPFIREHIQTIKPVYCFFENVEGHISLGLSTVISDLEADGYETTWGIFSATEVGAPHQRKRVFILAHTKGRKSWIKETGDRWKGSSGRSEKELGNTPVQRFKRHWPAWEQVTCKSYKEGQLACGTGQRWPARPGEEQHEWEEPRTI